MLFSNPKVLPALLLAVGISIILMRGEELKKYDQWNPADIDTAVELNYALDLVRLGTTQPTAEEEKARKSEIRREIEETFIVPQQRAQTEYRQGFWLAGLGAFLLVLVFVLQQRGILKK